MKLDAQTLSAMVANDEFGLLTVPVKPKPVTGEDRRVAKFNEIVEFVQAHGRQPERNRADIAETKLAMRLKNLISSDEDREALKPHDDLGLLTEPEPPKTLAEVFAADEMGLLDEGADLFELNHVPQHRLAPDKVARRESCEDFDRFENLFVECHNDLKSGRRKLRDFRNPSFIEEGKFFVQAGVLVYVAEIKELTQHVQGKDGRTRCIYENGTEADLLLRSLARSLYEDGQMVTIPDDVIAERMGLSPETKMGSVYVLRSLSTDPQLEPFKNLHKIGATTQPVERRLASAHKHATFLNAEVELLAEYQVPASIALAVEGLLQTFFEAARLDIWFEQQDTHIAEAREWFDVPLAVIDEAVQLIEAETIPNFRYDPTTQQIQLS